MDKNKPFKDLLLEALKEYVPDQEFLVRIREDFGDDLFRVIVTTRWCNWENIKVGCHADINELERYMVPVIAAGFVPILKEPTEEEVKKLPTVREYATAASMNRDRVYEEIRQGKKMALKYKGKLRVLRKL